jgi:N-acetylneuraminate synthase
MQDMEKRYECLVGLSDHCLRPYIAYAATALDAALIEKHLTLSRSVGGVDSTFSLEPEEFKEMVGGVQAVWDSIGGVAYGCTDSESTSARERPSIYVVRPIRRGEAFTRDNIRIIRPANGLPPKYYDRLIGSQCLEDLPSGTPLSQEFVKEADKLPDPKRPTDSETTSVQ